MHNAPLDGAFVICAKGMPSVERRRQFTPTDTSSRTVLALTLAPALTLVRAEVPSGGSREGLAWSS